MRYADAAEQSPQLSASRGEFQAKPTSLLNAQLIIDAAAWRHRAAVEKGLNWGEHDGGVPVMANTYDGQRTLPRDLDTAANRPRDGLPARHAFPVQLTAVHHNLPRRRAGA